MSLMFFPPVRRMSVSKRRPKSATSGFGKMLGKLDAASSRLAKSRPRR
jgi:hypothetical protein